MSDFPARGAEPHSSLASLKSVAFYAPGWPPGIFANGIINSVAKLRAGLLDRGVDVTVLAGVLDDCARNASDVVDVSEVRLRRFQFLGRRLSARVAGHDRTGIFLASSILGGVQGLKRRRVQVLEMEETFGAAKLVASHVSLPVVVRLHGPWFLVGEALGVPRSRVFHQRVAMEGAALATAAAISSPSRYTLDSAIEHYGLKPRLSAVIPNAQPVARPEHRWAWDRCERNTLLFVGRFDRVKGGDLVVNAFVQLAARFPDLHLIFVGPGGELLTPTGPRSFGEYLESRVPPQVRERIEFRPPCDQAELMRLRQRALVTIVASRYETFPGVALEALAQGCPVVAARAGGIPEIVDDGRTGLLFEAGNAEDLAAKLETILDNPDMGARMAEVGLRECEARFAPHVVADQTIDFYEEVLRVARPRAAVALTP